MVLWNNLKNLFNNRQSIWCKDFKTRYARSLNPSMDFWGQTKEGLNNATRWAGLTVTRFQFLAYLCNSCIHGLRMPNEAFFHWNPELLGWGRQIGQINSEALGVFSVELDMDFLKDGQISSFCPDQHEGELLTLIMLHKLTQSL